MIGERQDLVGEAMEHIEMLFAYRRRAFCAQPVHREVSLPQIHILMELLERGPTTVSQLAQLLDISAPSASAIVDRMEEHGLVRRERDDVDRRVVHVAVADRGRSLVDELSGLRHDHLQRLFAAMSDDELRAVINGVDAVRRALDRIQG